MQKVLITGANGMIAKYFKKMYNSNFELMFYTRNPKKENEFLWDIAQGKIDKEPLLKADFIIHLAGENIASKMWTQQRKNEILSSRVKPLRMMYDVLSKNNHKVKKIISASAIGYYGLKSLEEVNEKSVKGNGFLSDVCAAWEAETMAFSDLGVQANIVRLGLVLSNDGGALPALKKAFQFRINGLFGNGNSWQNWIHIEDVVRILNFVLMQHSDEKIFNAVSPNPLPQKGFNNLIFKISDRKKWDIAMPEIVLKFFAGDMSELFLQDVKVVPETLLKTGFQFKYESLENALQQLFQEG